MGTASLLVLSQDFILIYTKKNSIAKLIPISVVNNLDFEPSLG